MQKIANLNQHFDFLDDLPEGLYRAVVTLGHGNLQQRVKGIMRWREKLLSGQFPQMHELDWPALEIREIILRRLDGLQIIEQCKNEESLVDQILIAVCEAIASVIKRRQQGIHGLFEDILEKPFRKRQMPSEMEPEEELGSDANASSDHRSQAAPDFSETVNSVQSFNEGFVPDAKNHNEMTNLVKSHEFQKQKDLSLTALEKKQFSLRLQRALADSTEQWREIRAIFAGLATVPGRGWDLSKGQLKQQGWREVVYYRSLIKSYPQLITIVNSLGRTQDTVENKSSQQKNPSPESGKDQSNLPIESVITTPDPMIIKGINRGDDVARMLPSEAAYLGHPKLRMLWHVRRAEHALLSYLAQGVLSDHRPVDFPANNKKEKNIVNKSGMQQSGPVILCLDTSGSMKGEPEKLAKALCLEVIRLANQEKRDCYLYAFSGPEEIQELQLIFNQAGLKRIVKFLQSSFHGGTDVSGILDRALKKSREKQWRRADILLVSDGLFQVPNKLIVQVKHVKKIDGIRIHGLLINGWRSEAMQKICQPLHMLDEWQVRANK